jgi:hypothetical protein
MGANKIWANNNRYSIVNSERPVGMGRLWPFQKNVPLTPVGKLISIFNF